MSIYYLYRNEIRVRINDDNINRVTRGIVLTVDISAQLKLLFTANSI